MSYDVDQMDGAIAKAKSEVDQFIAELEKPSGSNYSVKAPISDSGETEHFWLTDISYKNGVFYGKIGNDPGLVTNVNFGQPWEIKKEDISDWTYIKDKKMYGNYTMIPLLKTLPAAEAQQYREMRADYEN
ncbi:UNVERIFIED_CONTAM: hypothetical protein GTU68_028734 [Idotea baltica]|nr:hypothetical protein [Idotea baltica]